MGQGDGRTWGAGVFPIVIGAPPDTEADACRALGEELAAMLAKAREKEVKR